MGSFSPLVNTLGTVSILAGLSGCGSFARVLTNSASPEASSANPPATAVSSADAADGAAPGEKTQTAENSASSAQAIAPQPPQPEPPRDYFREGVNRASSAVAIGQSAQSQDDWTLAVNRWQQAVDLLQQVPKTSTDYGAAQTKIQEYQNHLAAAQQRASRPVQAANSAVAAHNPPKRPNGLVAQIPIQERHGGTPVVSVTLHGQKGGKAFPMMFDTGATGTLITPEMADAIGVVIVDETQARIADGSIVTLPVGYLTAVEAGGLRKESVLVAIGGSVGLLGQDFYGAYGIAMGSHVINLHE